MVCVRLIVEVGVVVGLTEWVGEIVGEQDPAVLITTSSM
jgi:hypothetical protein